MWCACGPGPCHRGLLRCSGPPEPASAPPPPNLSLLPRQHWEPWGRVSEDSCLVWGSIPRAWHNVRPEATLVDEERGPVALPRLFWVTPAQFPVGPRLPLSGEIISPGEKVQTADSPRACTRPVEGRGRVEISLNWSGRDAGLNITNGVVCPPSSLASVELESLLRLGWVAVPAERLPSARGC